MNTADTSILNENIIYSTKQVGSVGSFPIFVFPGIHMPTIEDLFKKKTEEVEAEKLITPKDVDVLESAKKYYTEHKKSLLKKYKGKYIAILNNKIVGSDKDFSELAERIYKKFGYQTIFMPFVMEQERVIRIPSPRIKNF